MQDTLAHLLGIDDLVILAIDVQSTGIVLLASRRRIEERLIQYDEVPEVVLLEIIEDL
jgi:hypothetical protein